MRIHGTVTNGMFSNQRFLFEVIRKFESKPITVTVTRRKIKRTLPQNSYLWGVVYKIIADYIGDTDESVHDAMGQEFRGYRDDNGLKKVRSTTEMSTEEFTAYVERVRQWAAGYLNLNIPDPE